MKGRITNLECEKDVILGRTPALNITVELRGVLRKIYFFFYFLFFNYFFFFFGWIVSLRFLSHHLIEQWVDTVVGTGEGPQEFLYFVVELLRRLLVNPPPERHDVVRGPADDEARHQDAHHLH